MSIFFTTAILFVCSLLAGALGSLSGLGGGLVIVPLIAIGLGADIHYAIGASLIAVIATSTAASCAYVKEGFTNVRIGILLETATTIGAITGVSIGRYLPATILSIIFGLFLLYSAITALTQSQIPGQITSEDKISRFFKLDGTYPSKGVLKAYRVGRVPWGYFIMLIAGVLSGILGIGSGVLKVLALDKVMGIPFKVSTTTSNFMIGVTAAASAGLFLELGYIDPVITMPVVLGVTFGSLAGARLLPKVKTQRLRQLFAILLVVIAIQMFANALSKWV